MKVTGLPVITDDATHPTLRRRHAVQQVDLLGGADAARRKRLTDPATAYSVSEIEAKSALTDCELGGPPMWSLNPYVGCSHRCAYCYVPDVARLERSNWGEYVAVKRNLPTLLAAELKVRRRRPVFMSSATDCYQAAEATHLVTRRCLEQLVLAQWPVRLLTRSPLVLRDLDLLHRLRELTVGMSVPTLDDEARRIVEPGAPSIPVRLRTLRALADAGLEPYVNLAPQFPFTTHDPKSWALELAQAGVRQVNIMPWRYLDGIRGAMADAVRGTTLESWSTLIEDASYQRNQQRALVAALRAQGVAVWGELVRDAASPTPSWRAANASASHARTPGGSHTKQIPLAALP